MSSFFWETICDTNNLLFWSRPPLIFKVPILSLSIRGRERAIGKVRGSSKKCTTFIIINILKHGLLNVLSLFLSLSFLRLSYVSLV